MTDIFGLDVPFARMCGIEPVWHEPGHTRLSMMLNDAMMNSHGTVHGGAIMTLLDVALATAARTLLDTRVMTIDLQTAFLSPGRGRLIGEGRVVRAGRSLIFCEGDVRDAQNELVAKATGLFKVTRSKSKAG